jgi:hypothetical protein
MEIVAVDNGTVYLRGSKTFIGNEATPNRLERAANRSSDEAALTITAQVKQTAIKGKNVDASELSQVEVIRFDGRKSGSYRADGWDVAVSRQLSSYTPDVDTDLELLRQYESTLSEQQRNLTDRFKALKQEQVRFKREQARAGDRTRNTANDPQSQAAGNRGAEGPNATAPLQNSAAPGTSTAEAASAASKTPSAPGGNP